MCKPAASLKDGEVELIENVRFHKEEEKNDPAFAKELASLAEIYVNDQEPLRGTQQQEQENISY